MKVLELEEYDLIPGMDWLVGNNDLPLKTKMDSVSVQRTNGDFKRCAKYRNLLKRVDC